MNSRVLMTSSPEISVILPGYNEAASINAIVSQVQVAMTATGKSFEILYIDDASTDGSLQVLEQAKAEYQTLRVFYHHRNFGQSAAVYSGLEAARGELVITMDADLQNDPADIVSMIELLKQEQADMVCGVRQKRQDIWLKIFSARFANRVRRWALNDFITDAGCSMRVIRRSALAQLPAFRGLHRFLPTIMLIHGFKIIEMPVNHRSRASGVSKYGISNRMWVGMLDIMGLIWYRNRFFPPSRLIDRTRE